MPELWSVAITEADWKWLEVRGYGWLNKALDAVHGPDTDRGMSQLPLYTEELRKLVSEIGTWEDDCPGLLFALNTAVPAPHPVRMAREWSDRNGEWVAPVDPFTPADPVCDNAECCPPRCEDIQNAAHPDPFAAAEDERNEQDTIRRYVEQLLRHPNHPLAD